MILGLLLLGMGLLLKDSMIKAHDTTCRIGFVSLHALFMVHPEREKAEAALEARALEMQKQLEEETREMDLEEQQRLLSSYQQQLGLYEQELILEIIQQIEDSIAVVARREGISVVLEASHILYGGVDLTQKVIEYLGLEMEEMEEME